MRRPLVARLETDLTKAQAIADHVAERSTLEDIAVSLADAGGGRWQVAIHFHSEAEQEAVRAAVDAAAGAEAAAALRFGRIEAADWVRQSLAGLAPVEAGRFIVHGAHDRARVAKNRIGIEIEAALAFGTGHHGTTRGCLLALDGIGKASSRQRRPPRILDVGTGSGVLAIAAARALHAACLRPTSILLPCARRATMRGTIAPPAWSRSSKPTVSAARRSARRGASI